MKLRARYRRWVSPLAAAVALFCALGLSSRVEAGLALPGADGGLVGIDSLSRLNGGREFDLFSAMLMSDESLLASAGGGSTGAGRSTAPPAGAEPAGKPAPRHGWRDLLWPVVDQSILGGLSALHGGEGSLAGASSPANPTASHSPPATHAPAIPPTDAIPVARLSPGSEVQPVNPPPVDLLKPPR